VVSLPLLHTQPPLLPPDRAKARLRRAKRLCRPFHRPTAAANYVDGAVLLLFSTSADRFPTVLACLSSKASSTLPLHSTILRGWAITPPPRHGQSNSMADTSGSHAQSRAAACHAQPHAAARDPHPDLSGCGAASDPGSKLTSHRMFDTINT
jgi:hypothetical protein